MDERFEDSLKYRPEGLSYEALNGRTAQGLMINSAFKETSPALAVGARECRDVLVDGVIILEYSIWRLSQ
jgi:hypothetical protein